MNPKEFLVVIALTLFYTNLANGEGPDLRELGVANLKSTDYTAHLQITGTEVEEIIRDDEGRLAFFRFKVSAKVLETFKGKEMGKVEYYVVWESPAKGPEVGVEKIVSLNYSKDGEKKLFVPDVGYVLPVSEDLVAALKKAGEE